jgi:Fe-S cluster biogenesis protein NfuA/nitrite reductase/ring-hydroxylating ferredoxin subunit
MALVDGKERPAEDVAARIEELLVRLDSATDPAVRATAEELVRTLIQFYGSGLERIMELVFEDPVVAESLVPRFVGDKLVGSILVLHDLHPSTTEERVVEALERVRPYLGSHSGGVELLGVDAAAGIVFLRLAGSCDGCPSSTVTVKLAIEKAISETAPEIVKVEVEGMVEPAGPVDPGDRKMLPLSGAAQAKLSIPVQQEPLAASAPAWVEVGGLSALAPGKITAAKVSGVHTVVCNIDGDLYAYRDKCPSCGSGLTRGELTGQTLQCPRCGHGYDVRIAGRGTTTPSDHLDPFPLLSDQGTIRVAVAAR